MKNSLFKRAFATVAAVPVALAQCLTIANAVEVTDADASAVADSKTVVTLTGENGLLSIAPADDYSFVVDGTYEKVSDWNARVAGLISQAESGTVDASEIIAKAVAKSGKYQDLAAIVADKIGDINYTVNSNGDMIITADVDNVAPALEDIAQKLIDDVIADIVVEYDEQQEVIDELKSTKYFSDVEIAGTVKAVIKTGDLATSTVVTAEISFIDADGNEYNTLDGVKAYAYAKLDEVKKAAKTSLAKIVDKYDLTEEEIEQKIEESQEYKDLIEKYSQPITLNAEEVEAAVRASGDYKALVADLVAEGMTEEDAKAEIEGTQDYKDLIEKYSQEEISLTVEEVEAAVKKSDDYKAKVAEIKADYAEQFGLLNEKIESAQSKIDDVVDGYAAYITKAENAYNRVEDFSGEGTYADSRAFLAAVKNRVAKTRYSRFANRIPSTFEAGASTNLVGDIFTAIVNEINNTVSKVDLQVNAAEVGKYLDGFKNINVSVSNLVANGSAIYFEDDETVAAVKDYFVKNYGIDPDDDSFETYMQVDAVADFSGAENGTVSVDFQLKRVVKAPNAVTTTSGTTTSTATTPTTTSSESIVTTTTSKSDITTTTSKPSDISTTTTTTEDSSVGTTTTTTEPIAPPVTVTERAATVNSYTYGAEVGFYLNIDDEYDLSQITSISANVVKQIIIKNEDGEIIEIQPDGKETVDITGMVNFGTQKPSDKTSNSVMETREVLVYASEDIQDSNGTTFLTAGDLLVNSNGSEVVVPAYVGVKGDIDFSGAADASDSARVLYIYAQVQTGEDPDSIKFSPNDAVESAGDILDQFAAFLADVDAEDAANNHTTYKSIRGLDSSDAAYILAAYARVQSGASEDRAMWDEVLGK